MKQLKASSKVFDVSYLSVDSIQEGVGSSQIIPLVKALARLEMKISLTTFEKHEPPESLRLEIAKAGIAWNVLRFGKPGAFYGLFRLCKLFFSMPNAEIIHARSDIPAVAAALRFPKNKILWDVRSLWADQRQIIDSKGWNNFTTFVAKKLEIIAASRSLAIVTLTWAVIPVLERRHKKLPMIRDVIPTAAQLDKFVVEPFCAKSITCLLSGTFNNFYDLKAMQRVISELRLITPIDVVWARPSECTTNNLNVGEDSIISALHNEMPKLIRDAHFGLVICKDENSTVLTAVMPTKVAEFLASGRPVLVSKGIGDLDSLIESRGVGILLDLNADISPSLLRFIDLLNDPAVHIRCRKVAEEIFDMIPAIDKYCMIYKKMVNYV